MTYDLKRFSLSKISEYQAVEERVKMRKKSFLVTVSLFAVIALATMYFWQFETNKASGNGDMFNEINNMALPAQSLKPDAVSQLVDVIFEHNHFDQLDPALVDSLKDRVVRAEVNGQTISETQTVQAFNWLADQYAAPDYAKVSPLQVRVMRGSLTGLMPDLFVDKDGHGNIGVNKLVGSQPSSNLSPTQTVTLMTILVRQKVSSPYFQKTPSQWDVDYLADLESGYLQQQQDNSNNNPPQFIARVDSEETKQMHRLIYGTSFSPTQQETITQGVLDQLGIPR